MNKFIVTLFTFISFSFLSANEEYLVQKIGRTIESLENRNDVWNTFNLSTKPIIVTFSNGHIYAFNLKSNNPAWTMKNANLLFSETDEWGVAKIAMQDNFIIDGQQTFVFHINENEPNGFLDRPVLVLIHELFHGYQFSRFIEPSDVGEYVDQLNPENLALIHLEERILIDFLGVKDEYRLDILKNYIAVHQARIKLIDPSSLKWERFQQVMEGLADYASITALPEFDAKKHLRILLGGYIRGQDPQELAVKWRHYGTGAALGMALDFLSVHDWKERVEVNGESQDSILEEALVLSKKERAKRLKFVKKHYRYKEVLKETTKKIAAFESMIDKLMHEYDAQDGFIVRIERPRELAVNGGGKNYGIFHLTQGTTLSVKDTSVSSTADNLWKLALKDIPFMIQNSQGERIVKVCVDLRLSIDGQIYSIEELRAMESPISFHSLSWECKHSNFETVKREGKLIFTEEGFLIILN